MKTKRCTNSSCRKVFRVETHTCPYCGKKYPRANPCTDKYAVVLTSVEFNRTLSVIKAIRAVTGLGLKDAKTIIDHVPSLVGRFQATQAEALKADICTAGGEAIVIPVRRGTKGIFVLPKKVG